MEHEFSKNFWFKLRRIASVTNNIQIYNTTNQGILYYIYCDNQEEHIEYWTKEFDKMDTLGVISLLKALSNAARTIKLNYPEFGKYQIYNCELMVDYFVNQVEKLIKEKNPAQVEPIIQVFPLDRLGTSHSYWISFDDFIFNGQIAGGYEATIATIKSRLSAALETFNSIT